MIKKIFITYIQIWLITRYTIWLIGLRHTDSTPKYRIQNNEKQNSMYDIHICKTIIVDLDQSWFRLSPFRMCTRSLLQCYKRVYAFSPFIVFHRVHEFADVNRANRKKKKKKKKKKEKGQKDARDRKERFILSSFNS